MGKRLNAVFQRTLQGIERAHGDFDVLSELLDDGLVAEVLSLPKREVPQEIRAFFEEWQRRSEEIDKKSETLDDIELSDDATIDEAEDYLGKIENLGDDIKQFKVWIVTNAPADVPNEIISATQMLLNELISECTQALERTRSMMELAMDFAETFLSKNEE